MACCKCEEHEWYDPQSVIYTDSEDDKEYCLFHAPAEHKGMSVDEFNEHVSERIQATIDLEDEDIFCDFRGTVFPGEICFEQYSALPKISFSEARFGGRVLFPEARFEGYADFGKANFEGDADFGKASFGRSAYFGKARFGEGAHFIQARFGTEGANFYGARFEGYTYFLRARFGGDSNFSTAQFNGPLRFESIETDNAILIFAHCTVSPSAMTFKKCDPTCLDLTQQYDLVNIHFIDSPWEKNGRIKACTEDQEGNLQPTRDFYQRMKAKYKAENNEYEASKWHVAEKEAQLKLLDQETKPLRESFMNAGDTGAVKKVWTALTLQSDETLAVSLFGWLSPLFNVIADRLTFRALWLYKYSSGYGEKPFHALFWLVLFVLLPVLPFIFPGSMLYYLPLMQEHPNGDFWVTTRFWMIFWQILVSVQAALFAFALRNRFRR